MDTATLSSFVVGILTTLVVGVIIFGSLRFYPKTDVFRRGAPYIEDRQQFVDITEQLGMSHEELRRELSQGKSMMDMARERGVVLKLPPRWMRRDDRQQFLRGMADHLGMNIEQLQEELSTGKRLMDITKEHGVTLTFPDSEFPNAPSR